MLVNTAYSSLKITRERQAETVDRNVMTPDTHYTFLQIVPEFATNLTGNAKTHFLFLAKIGIF